jgi:hypothetical protein
MEEEHRMVAVVLVVGVVHPMSVLEEMHSETVPLWPVAVAVAVTVGTGTTTTEVTVVVSQEKQVKQTTVTTQRIAGKEEHKPQEVRVQPDGVLLPDRSVMVVVRRITEPAVVVVTTVEVLDTTVEELEEDLVIPSIQQPP